MDLRSSGVVPAKPDTLRCARCAGIACSSPAPHQREQGNWTISHAARRAGLGLVASSGGLRVIDLRTGKTCGSVKMSGRQKKERMRLDILDRKWVLTQNGELLAAGQSL